jgi:hypothetical protein
MLKDVGIICVCDSVGAIVIACFIFPRTSIVYECSPEMFWVAAGFFLYQCFFVLRNLLTMLCSYWSRKPDDRALLIRISYSLIDWVALFALVLWSTLVMMK